MNPEHEKQLEQQVDRVLKRLPELSAPATLMPRVMRAIAARQSLRWYQTSWEVWPMGLRVASMTVLVAAFAGLCVAAWQLTQAVGYIAATEEVRNVFSSFTVVWSTVQVLLGAVVVVFKHMGSGFMIGCLAAAGLAYAVCVAAGTAFFRLALARN